MEEDNHIFKRHNKILLLYHIVFPVKYRKEAITEAVENTLKEVCVGISRSHTFFDTKYTKYVSKPNSNNDKKYNRKDDI